MNHLNAVCGPYTPSGTHFVIDPVFPVATSSLPIASSATRIGASSDPAVIDLMSADDGVVGYMGTANYLNQASAAARYATVDNLDPVSDLPATFNLLPNSVAFDKVLGGTGLVSVTPNTTANCLAVVNPSAYANPASGYPIVAVSYLLVNQKGNSTNLNSLRSFLAFTYTHAGVTKIGAGTGLSFIGNAGITTLKINSCTAP
jgi:ABC-type phosphate transport system substrate-binding protein